MTLHCTALTILYRYCLVLGWVVVARSLCEDNEGVLYRVCGSV